MPGWETPVPPHVPGGFNPGLCLLGLGDTTGALGPARSPGREGGALAGRGAREAGGLLAAGEVPARPLPPPRSQTPACPVL